MCDEKNDSELVIGLVAPVGVNLDLVQHILSDYLNQYKYETVNIIKISKLIPIFAGKESEIKVDTEYNRTNSLMTAGNKIRKKAKFKDVDRYGVLSAIAMIDIHKKRKHKNKKGNIELKPLKRQAHIISSLKHPDEARLLRYTYSHGFFLIGISSSEENRLKYLIDQKGMTKKKARRLIRRDQEEKYNYGQHTRDVFELADGFIDIDAIDANKQISRILDLLFGHPYITPTADEYAMYLAYSSSLRSSDLSRQVGAVIMSKKGDLISTGANDVPKFGGGLYWPNDKNVYRDYEKKYDSNEMQKNELIDSILNKLKKEVVNDIQRIVSSINKNKKVKVRQLFNKYKKRFLDEKSENFVELYQRWKKWLKETDIKDITEYGRAVHAEMEAILSCARSGVSPRGGTLYSTTFPCHNCAKHIVGAGIKRVVFVEPYPKSKAINLHDDSICLPHENNPNQINEDKIRFEPFVGVAHRRFLDLFSMKSSTGIKIYRKKDGKIKKWKRKNTFLRVPLIPLSYMEREGTTVKDTLEYDFIKKRNKNKPNKKPKSKKSKKK